MLKNTTYRVFLDANVIFSGVHTPQGTPGRLLLYASELKFHPVVSSAVLREVVRNLDRKLSSRPPGLNSLLGAGIFEIRPEPSPAQVDPWLERGFGTDAAVIASALEAEVDDLCTGDRKLLQELPQYSLRFDILSPRQLMDMLSKESPRDR